MQLDRVSTAVGVGVAAFLGFVVSFVVFQVVSGGDLAPVTVSVREDLQVADGVVDVFHDEELGVTCWTFEARYAKGGGVSCLPDWFIEPPLVVR